MKKFLTVILCVCFISGVSFADTFAEGTANEFTIDFVSISGDSGDLGNWSAGTNYTFSGVNHGDYRMGTYEITNDQWTKFTNSLGVPVTGSPSTAYDLDPTTGIGSKPINNVSWYEAAQFVNWLNTSSGYQAAYKFTGTQGQSDYAFALWDVTDSGFNASNQFRNSNAIYFLPTEDEWVKAAYWNGTDLQTYATIDDTIPIPGLDTNYFPAAYYSSWNVGSGTEEINGTFDMMGNIYEMMESPRIHDQYYPDVRRVTRGGSYMSSSSVIASSYGYFLDPDLESVNLGFRIASVPEPTTLLLVGLGAVMIRRRK